LKELVEKHAAAKKIIESLKKNSFANESTGAETAPEGSVTTPTPNRGSTAPTGNASPSDPNRPGGGNR
jgi:hypothetical protein